MPGGLYSEVQGMMVNGHMGTLLRSDGMTDTYD